MTDQVNRRLDAIIRADQSRIDTLSEMAANLANLIRRKHVTTIATLARLTNKDEKTLRERLDRILKVLDMEPDLAQRLMRGGATDPADVHSAWLKDKDGDSVYVYFGKNNEQSEANTIDRIREAMSNIPTAPTVVAPSIPWRMHTSA
jgi:hypothetical protein